MVTTAAARPFINGPFDGDPTLGHFGRDTTNHVVWAVMNNSSDFAVIMPDPVAMTGAASRKMHGGLGPFDLDLLTPPQIECRTPQNDKHTLVFTFNNNVISGNATVTQGTVSSTGTPTFSGNTMSVDLNGVANAQTVQVTLSSVTDSFFQVLPDAVVTMGVLLGDVNASGVVDGNDVSAVQNRTRQSVNNTNFRYDVNTSGLIDGNDVSMTQAHTRTSLP
jgi:hypothetical protein